ncbi:DUF4843 domain-containing protein [Butyricimonas paravirosa]|mgnify:CR=1 FL=1|uniref:DUF4843 domain-containing protein n=1 Tax=Butyricimonas paravirosa TaxID=1472417 RepID=UPI0026DF13CD|nr:DUF4843 domain-containing protein [Butyricimonas paravirosa]
MKGYLKYIVLAVASLLTFSSCEEKDVEVYGNDAYLVFEMPGLGQSNTLRDSLVFSFPVKGDECVEDTLWFKARIIGKSVPYDRVIELAVNGEKTTAVANENYKLDPIVMPADAYTVDVPLVVYRAGLQGKSVRLELTVEPNEFFGVGFDKTSKAIFWWGDMYIKPDNWETTNYKPCFGEFTETRYAFILKACGIVELPDPQDLVTMGFYNAKVREALYEYNSTHEEPLTDEKGRVEFPKWTGQGGIG